MPETPLLVDRDPNLGQHYRRWRPALLAFFLKRTHDHAEAEDLTHEAFARIAQADDAPHAGYIFQVAANLLRDRARRARVRADGFETLSALYGRGSDGLDPERVACGREAIGRLIARLGELPERTRSIFVLYRVENVGKRVIADSLGISTSAVEKHLTRAMAYLMTRGGDGA